MGWLRSRQPERRSRHGPRNEPGAYDDDIEFHPEFYTVIEAVSRGSPHSVIISPVASHFSRTASGLRRRWLEASAQAAFHKPTAVREASASAQHIIQKARVNRGKSKKEFFG